MTKKQLFILLFQLGFGISFSLGGTLALSEIFLLLFFITQFHKIIKYYKIPEIVTITKLYGLLFFAQLMAEILVGNVFSNSIKILAVTFMSYLQFVFLLVYFLKDRKYVLYALAGFALKYLIFGSQFDSDSSMEAVASGQAATYVKFVLIHLVFNPILIMTVFIKNKKKMVYLVLSIGLLFVILGSRSGGALFALTGLLSYFVLKGRKINKGVLLKTIGLTLFIGYGLYAFYVSNVKSGDIVSGNSSQILKLENPYNPVNLLMMGRTETFVGAVAFVDKLWTGHGAWARDTTGKYRMMLFQFRSEEYKAPIGVTPLIPAHSVIIGAGVRNGVFALICMCMLLFNFFKIGLKGISKKDPYLVIILYFLIQLLWHAMFSPIGHLRQTFPLYFSFLLVSYLLQKKHQKQMFINKYQNKKELR